jgi:hypothetical protein
VAETGDSVGPGPIPVAPLAQPMDEDAMASGLYFTPPTFGRGLVLAQRPVAGNELHAIDDEETADGWVERRASAFNLPLVELKHLVAKVGNNRRAM